MDGRSSWRAVRQRLPAPHTQRDARLHQPPPPTTLSEALSLAALCAAAVVLAGCDGSSTPYGARMLHSLGFSDPAPPSPQTYFIVCDASLDSTCEGGELDAQLRLVGQHLVTRPGSHLEVHLVAARAEENLVLGRLDVPPITERNARALAGRERRFLDSLRAQVCGPALRELRAARPRRSPLAETLTRVSLSTASGERHVVVLTDLREYSEVLDAECAELPTERAWIARLRRRSFLPPGSFANTTVHFARASAGPVSGRGCRWSVGREIALRALWRAALEAAGASAVTFSTDVFDPAQLAPTTPESTTPLTDGGTR